MRRRADHLREMRLTLANKWAVVYNDSQNVHNATINESVITAARSLIEKMVATVTFDGRYKFNVFREDNVKSITYRLAKTLKKSPSDISIFEYNSTNSDTTRNKLQPKMTFNVKANAQSIIKSRFKPEDIDQYDKVMFMRDYLFPPDVVREGENGRLLEEIFVCTNSFFSRNCCNKDLPLYLNLSNIESVFSIWHNRSTILHELYKIIGNNKLRDNDINEFMSDVFDDLFPFQDMSSFINVIKTSTVRDIKLLELLNAVWKFIYTKQGVIFTELKNRLREEILESLEVCTSGVCAHLVSVIQGYFDDSLEPSLKIKISIIDEIKAKLTKNINKLAIEREIDPIVDSEEFKILIDEYVEENANDMLSGFTVEELEKTNVSKLRMLAYDIYVIV
jgi:hypothetical protein